MASYTGLPKLSGPFPQGSASTDDINRLGDFVHLISQQADVKNRYTQEKLNEHTKFIEDNMQILIGKVGQYDSLLKCSELLRRGSSYGRAKILWPDEYDYMPILANFNTNTVEVEDVNPKCYNGGKGDGYVKLKPGALSTEGLDKYTGDCLSSGLFQALGVTQTQKYLCSRKICDELRKAVVWSLQQMDTLTYIGETNQKDPSKSQPYKKGDVSINAEMHGPSFWLRIGGPICTTDVDLCFAIEGVPPMPQGRCLMIDGALKANICSCGYLFSGHWKKSIVDPPVNSKYVLTESHRKLFLTLKYISHVAAEMSGQVYPYSPDILSSYDVNLVILKHQESCLAVNVGECFYDTVRRFLKPDQAPADVDMKNLDISYNPAYYPIQRYDIFFPKRHVHIKKLHSIVAIAWFMYEVIHTEDATWINRLLAITNETHTHAWWERDIQLDGTLKHGASHNQSKQLSGLLKAIRKADSWFARSEGSRNPLTLEWGNRDGKTRDTLTLKYFK